MKRCRKVFPGRPKSYERPVVVNGMRGWYTDVGAGPTVVILASSLVLARSYEWLIDCLAPHFRVVTVELPGSGRASRPPRPWGFDDYAGWVAGLLDALSLDRPTLIGHSNSGGAALLVAGRHPGKIGRLVLVGSVGGDESPSLLRVIVGRAIDAVLEPRLTLFGWHHVIGNSIVHFRDFFGQVWKSVYENLLPQARDVTVPTLVAWGAHDHTIPPRCGEALRRAIPNASLYISKEGSHDWLIVRAPEFTALLRAFVEATTRH